MNKRVVVTGIGAWTCIGTDIDIIKCSLYEGKSGIGIDEARVAYGFRSPLTGIVEKPQLKDSSYLAGNEVGCIFGNDSTAEAVIKGYQIMAEKHDSELVGSGSIFQSMNSTVNMNLCSIFGLRGINFTVSAACASGSHSIGLGYMLIKQGLQDMILCGGAQEVNMYGMSSFDAIRTFSMALVLEEYEHAKARGAEILCEVCGYGFSSNGGGISQPSDEGSALAMMRAMKDAAIEADDVDYINAHATSTPRGDMVEAMALSRLFDKKHAWISSTKSMTGHECWMAGASELVYSIVMMQNNFVAPNINFMNPDEYSEKLHLATKTIDMELDVILSNSFGFGGTNSALVIKKLNK